jgi:Rrf2 family transcriptional regulator, nitric oxide-sensitive transcriptional repressor
MRLTRYSDYAMRVLLYLAARPDELCSISEITRAYGISQSHLMKVVNDLVNAGYLISVRGRFGGIRLARPATEIKAGDVIRHTEEGFALVDCANCIIAPACGLTGALNEAVSAFLAVLDKYSLDDLMAKRAVIIDLFQPGKTGTTGSARNRPANGRRRLIDPI